MTMTKTKPSSRTAVRPLRGPAARPRGWVRALRFAAAGMTGVLLAGSASAQPSPPIIAEPLGLDANYNATVLTVDLPPNPRQPPTTAGTPGHRHPGSTYAY